MGDVEQIAFVEGPEVFRLVLPPDDHEEEESEGTVGSNESGDKEEGSAVWGQCYKCSDKGPLGHHCLRCEDMGMIYDGPCCPPGSDQDGDEDSRGDYTVELEEYHEMWMEFFPRCGLSEEQVGRIDCQKSK